MKLLASFATALFVTQVAMCGVRGFGLGALAQDVPVASCHGAAPSSQDGATPGGDDGERSRCRAHCQLFQRGLAGSAPDVDAPARVVTSLPGLAVAWALPAHSHAPRAQGALPPGVPLPILHASLLI